MHYSSSRLIALVIVFSVCLGGVAWSAPGTEVPLLKEAGPKIEKIDNLLVLNGIIRFELYLNEEPPWSDDDEKESFETELLQNSLVLRVLLSPDGPPLLSSVVEIIPPKFDANAEKYVVRMKVNEPVKDGTSLKVYVNTKWREVTGERRVEVIEL